MIFELCKYCTFLITWTCTRWSQFANIQTFAAATFSHINSEVSDPSTVPKFAKEKSITRRLEKTVYATFTKYLREIIGSDQDQNQKLFIVIG